MPNLVPGGQDWNSVGLCVCACVCVCVWGGGGGGGGGGGVNEE